MNLNPTGLVALTSILDMGFISALAVTLTPSSYEKSSGTCCCFLAYVEQKVQKASLSMMVHFLRVYLSNLINLINKKTYKTDGINYAKIGAPGFCLWIA